jgi:hypothetical protein
MLSLTAGLLMLLWNTQAVAADTTTTTPKKMQPARPDSVECSDDLMKITPPFGLGVNYVFEELRANEDIACEVTRSGDAEHPHYEIPFQVGNCGMVATNGTDASENYVDYKITMINVGIVLKYVETRETYVCRFFSNTTLEVVAIAASGEASVKDETKESTGVYTSSLELYSGSEYSESQLVSDMIPHNGSVYYWQVTVGTEYEVGEAIYVRSCLLEDPEQKLPSYYIVNDYCGQVDALEYRFLPSLSWNTMRFSTAPFKYQGQALFQMRCYAEVCLNSACKRSQPQCGEEPRRLQAEDVAESSDSLASVENIVSQSSYEVDLPDSMLTTLGWKLAAEGSVEWQKARIASRVKIIGHFTMSVTDTTLFTDEAHWEVRNSVASGIAQSLPGIKPEWVTIVKISSQRRLAASGSRSSLRRLTEGKLDVEYEINAPNEEGLQQIETTLASDDAELVAHINTALEAVGIAETLVTSVTPFMPSVKYSAENTKSWAALDGGDSDGSESSANTQGDETGATMVWLVAGIVSACLLMATCAAVIVKMKRMGKVDVPFHKGTKGEANLACKDGTAGDESPSKTQQGVASSL